ncbi:hypothetical protein 206_0165 [Phage 206]|nr:hypothetical protein 203_0165 [Phage 203]ATW61729.1 hypothetical protein 206_0165 [Phage 206]USL84558.1 hypothetical protein I29_166 [Escherichia phage I29]
MAPRSIITTHITRKIISVVVRSIVIKFLKIRPENKAFVIESIPPGGWLQIFTKGVN